VGAQKHTVGPDLQRGRGMGDTAEDRSREGGTITEGSGHTQKCKMYFTVACKVFTYLHTCQLGCMLVNVKHSCIHHASTCLLACMLVRISAKMLTCLRILHHPIPPREGSYHSIRSPEDGKGWPMFAKVPDSSINSWESWFIFNLRK
jgi:hypothetical protein